VSKRNNTFRDAHDKQTAIEHWSKNLSDSKAFSRNTYWLAIPEVWARYNQKVTEGTTYATWTELLVGEFLKGKTPVSRMLSLGCGDGSLERTLAGMKAFEQCDAFDIAPSAIEAAQNIAKEQGLVNIHYDVQDLNHTIFLANQYDAAWFNASLHHILALEHVCQETARTLKPDGFLFLNEYIGPSRFNFTERQKEVMRAAFTLIPQRFRRNFVPGASSQYQESAPIPDPFEVYNADPTESARSSEIMQTIEKYFEIARYYRIGGTILQFLLAGLAGNFHAEDPESMRVLEMLFNIEDTLMEVGELQSDFAVVVARPKK
jgi:2-polyprenyl-3-methyl-5-hydroxy-6-metoxy-1,4-benzoquinol methylase